MGEGSHGGARKSLAESGPPDRDAVAARIADALRLFVGPRLRYSRELIAAATGMEVRTIKAHCLGECPPSVASLLAYFRILPVEFADHVLGLAGLTGARRIDRAIAPGLALASMGHGLAALADALADGRIDHVERRTLPRTLRETAAAAEKLAAELDAE